MASRSFNRGFRDRESMYTARLLKAEVVFVVSRVGEIEKFTQAEWRVRLKAQVSTGERACLTEKEAQEVAEQRKARAAAPAGGGQ